MSIGFTIITGMHKLEKNKRNMSHRLMCKMNEKLESIREIINTCLGLFSFSKPQTIYLKYLTLFNQKYVNTRHKQVLNY